MTAYLGDSEFDRRIDDLDYELSILAEPVTLTATQLATIKKLILVYCATTLEVDHLRSEVARLEDILISEGKD